MVGKDVSLKEGKTGENSGASVEELQRPITHEHSLGSQGLEISNGKYFSPHWKIAGQRICVVVRVYLKKEKRKKNKLTTLEAGCPGRVSCF